MNSLKAPTEEELKIIKSDIYKILYNTDKNIDMLTKCTETLLECKQKSILLKENISISPQPHQIIQMPEYDKLSGFDLQKLPEFSLQKLPEFSLQKKIKK